MSLCSIIKKIISESLRLCVLLYSSTGASLAHDDVDDGIDLGLRLAGGDGLHEVDGIHVAVAVDVVRIGVLRHDHGEGREQEVTLARLQRQDQVLVGQDIVCLARLDDYILLIATVYSMSLFCRRLLLLSVLVVGLLDAPRLQFAVEKTIDVSGTLVIEASGVTLQTLVSIGVDDRSQSLLYGELRIVVHQQQGKVLHHVEFHLFLFAHSRLRILTARSVPKKY